jgi:DNA repair photolyase
VSVSNPLPAFSQSPPLELLSSGDEHLRLLRTQSDLQYHAAPVRGIFNSPAATGMGFWSINPYVGCAFGCAYCYARDTHRWTIERAGNTGSDVAGDLPPWLAFERRILVKENAASLVRSAFRSGRAPAPGECVLIGSATDPYQPAERHHRITRSVLEVLAEVRGVGVTIITKSPLVTRDIDVLARVATRGKLSVHISLITVDRDLARQLEPRAPTPEARLRAVRRLSEAGISVGVNCMPVLPGITDKPEMLEALAARVADAGAHNLAACALRLRATARRRYLPLIQQSFPDLADRYRKAYANGIHVSESYRLGLKQFMMQLCRKHGLDTRVYREDRDEDSTASDVVEAVPAQLDLDL